MSSRSKWLTASAAILLIAGAGVFFLFIGHGSSSIGQTVNAGIDDLMAVGVRILDLPLFMLLAASLLFAAVFAVCINRLSFTRGPHFKRAALVTMSVAILMTLAFVADRHDAQLQREVNTLREQISNQRLTTMNAPLASTEVPATASTAAARVQSPAQQTNVQAAMAVPNLQHPATLPVAAVPAPAKKREATLVDLDKAKQNLAPYFSGVEIHPFIYDQSTDILTVTASNPQICAIAAVIDLTLPGIEVHVGGGLDAKTLTSDFARKNGSTIAINGEAGIAPAANLGLGTWRGYMMDAGVMKVQEIPLNPRPFLSFDKNNRPTFVAQAVTKRVMPADAFNIIWGRLDAIIDGTVQTQNERDRQPRTAMGINKEGTRLYLMVVDGRQQGYSVGFTRAEVGYFLKALGASNAMLCDEGGSSCIYTSRWGIMNYPSDGEERSMYTHFGIKYTPQ